MLNSNGARREQGRIAGFRLLGRFLAVFRDAGSDGDVAAVIR